MPKCNFIKPTLFVLLATVTAVNAADLRAGMVIYDGGPAIYSMVNGQHFICDNCPPVPMLVAKLKPQSNSFSVKATVSPTTNIPNALPASPLSPAITPPVVHSANKPIATVYFIFDSAVLSGEGKAALKQTFEGSKLPVVVKVKGHTCRLGARKHNEVLSLQRAKAVKSYLGSVGVKVAGIEGLGSSQPIGGKLAVDRRAEVLIAEEDESKKGGKTVNKQEVKKEEKIK